MTKRVYNFSPGPATIPESVLQQVQEDLLSLPGLGMSVMEISHRSPEYAEIHDGACKNLRALLGIPENYQILLLQGGSRLQFSMVPINLLRGTGQIANYIVTGSWGKKAYAEAKKEGDVFLAADCQESGYDHIPTATELQIKEPAAYVYFTSNETIEGVQFSDEPNVGSTPLVCDASSDFLCRPLPIEHYGLIYACAQKNAGPAGVTVVIIRDDLLLRSAKDLPGYLNYQSHAENNSLYNTPPTFAIYVLKLITNWLLNEVGGLEAMHRLNARKAEMLYNVIDNCDGFYTGHAQPDARSIMNVTFQLPDDNTQATFLTAAKSRDLVNLKGHRSVGGIRASIYNAMPAAGVEALRDLMREFYECRAN